MPYNSVLANGTSPSYTSGANGLNPFLPDDVSADIIANATQKSAALTMLKKQQMGTRIYRMPVLATKPIAYWVTGDTGLKQTTTAAWANKFLQAEEIAVIIPIAENLVEDINVGIWDLVKPEIEEAIGVALDAAVFFGINKPASWPSAIAVAAIAAGNTVTQGTSAIDVADDLNNVMMTVEADGYRNNGFWIRQDVEGLFRGLRDSQKNFIFLPSDPGMSNTVFNGTVFGKKAVTSMSGVFESQTGANQVKLITGDWSQAILGVRKDITIKMLDQAVLQDSNGDIIFNLAQQDMVAMRVTARFGFQVPNPVNRQQPTEGSRYPFGVLRHNT